MRKLVISTLLLVVPFSGMRVICLDAPAPAAAAAPIHEDTEDDCERICAVHRPSSSGDEDCSVTAAASSLIMLGGIVVIPRVAPPALPVVTPYTYAVSGGLYLEPGLARLSPPPKTHVLL